MRCLIANRSVIALAALLVFGPALLATAGHADDVARLRGASKAFSAVAKKAMPAVVFIQVEKKARPAMRGQMPNFRRFGPGNMPFDPFERFFGKPHRGPQTPSPEGKTPQPQWGPPPQYKQRGQGSGFIVSPDGYILTNNHVVGDADEVKVKMGGRKVYKAKIVGTDPKSDVAVIKIDAKDLPYLKLGSSEKLEIGEWVMAIGNPFGLTETLTVGVVSAKGRSQVGITDYEDFIQTDAAINPGNSGGPLLDLDGNVVGINTAIFSRSGGYMGIGFAIPAKLAKHVMDQLIAHGKVTRGYLGVIIQNVNEKLAESFGLKSAGGVLISQVLENTPAAKAHLKGGDIILSVNGRKAKNVGLVRNTVSMVPPDTDVKLRILRDKKEMDITVRIGALPETGAVAALGGKPEASGLAEKLGLRVQDLDAKMAEQFGYKTGEGVLINHVEPNSPAAEAQLSPGMLVMSVNQSKVGSVAEFNKALQKSTKTKRALLLVKEKKFSRFVVLSLD